MDGSKAENQKTSYRQQKESGEWIQTAMWYCLCQLGIWKLNVFLLWKLYYCFVSFACFSSLKFPFSPPFSYLSLSLSFHHFWYLPSLLLSILLFASSCLLFLTTTVFFTLILYFSLSTYYPSFFFFPLLSVLALFYCDILQLTLLLVPCIHKYSQPCKGLWPSGGWTILFKY